MGPASVIPSEVERYLALPYHIELIPAGGEWFVHIPDLPGCMSQGETVEEAVAAIREAQRLWIEVALEDGIPIPEPRAQQHAFTGRFNIRLPKEVHRALVAHAAAEGVSLNLYVATILAQAIVPPKKTRHSVKG